MPTFNTGLAQQASLLPRMPTSMPALAGCAALPRHILQIGIVGVGAPGEIEHLCFLFIQLLHLQLRAQCARRVLG